MELSSHLAVGDPEWLAFVQGRPEALPFHLPAWTRTVAGSYRLRAFVLAVRDASGAITAGMPMVETRLPLRPKRWVSLPFTDYCPPLSVSPDAERRLADAIEAARREAGVSRVEVRGPMVGSRAVSLAGYRHVLALEPDAAAVFARFHRSQVQRNIRRAEKGKVRIRTGTPEEDLLDDFYSLHVGTRRRLGVPVQPKSFFSSLRDQILRSGIGWVTSAELDGKPIAAALFMAANETVVYKFGASESTAWSLRPNHLIFWDAIRNACAAGFRQLDFGRTDVDAAGLRSFKRSWGTEEEELVYHAFGGDGRMQRMQQTGFAQRALSGVIRRSPEWVCRWSGEVLYRFVV